MSKVEELQLHLEDNEEPWRALSRKTPQLQCGDRVEGPKKAMANLLRQKPPKTQMGPSQFLQCRLGKRECLSPDWHDKTSQDLEPETKSKETFSLILKLGPDSVFWPQPVNSGGWLEARRPGQARRCPCDGSGMRKKGADQRDGGTWN